MSVQPTKPQQTQDLPTFAQTIPSTTTSPNRYSSSIQTSSEPNLVRKWWDGTVSFFKQAIDLILWICMCCPQKDLEESKSQKKNTLKANNFKETPQTKAADIILQTLQNPGKNKIVDTTNALNKIENLSLKADPNMETALLEIFQPFTFVENRSAQFELILTLLKDENKLIKGAAIELFAEVTLTLKQGKEHARETSQKLQQLFGSFLPTILEAASADEVSNFLSFCYKDCKNLSDLKAKLNQLGEQHLQPNDKASYAKLLDTLFEYEGHAFKALEHTVLSTTALGLQKPIDLKVTLCKHLLGLADADTITKVADLFFNDISLLSTLGHAIAALPIEIRRTIALNLPSSVPDLMQVYQFTKKPQEKPKE